jgi:hypothetical protein
MSMNELVTFLQESDAAYEATTRAQESDTEAWLFALRRWLETRTIEGPPIPEPPTEAHWAAFPVVARVFGVGRNPPAPGSHAWQLARAHCHGCWLFRVRQSTHYDVALFEGMVGMLDHLKRYQPPAKLLAWGFDFRMLDPYSTEANTVAWGMDFGVVGWPPEHDGAQWVPLHCVEPASFAELKALAETTPTWPAWSDVYGRPPRAESVLWKLSIGPPLADDEMEAEAYRTAAKDLDALDGALVEIYGWIERELPSREVATEASHTLHRVLSEVAIHPAHTELVDRYAALRGRAMRTRKAAARIVSFLSDGREDRARRTLEGLRSE